MPRIAADNLFPIRSRKPLEYFHLHDADHLLIATDEISRALAEQVVARLRAENMRFGWAFLPSIPKVRELAAFLHRTSKVAIVSCQPDALDPRSVQALLRSIETEAQDGDSAWFGRMPSVYYVQFDPSEPAQSLENMAREMAQSRLNLTPLPLRMGTRSAGALGAQLISA